MQPFVNPVTFKVPLAADALPVPAPPSGSLQLEPETISVCQYQVLRTPEVKLAVTFSALDAVVES